MMRVSDELREELLKAILSVYTTARNGLPAEPRTAEEMEARMSVSRSSYMHDCMCRATVDRALHYMLIKIEDEYL